MGFKAYLENVRKHDPAMKTAAEIVLYPSFWAVGFHRIGHWLYKRSWYWLARAISQFSRWVTGIEIHPGATIGKCLFIDHGMGVVIGETCEIGDYVTIYQGVTLGGTGNETGKRHPTIGDYVLISTGAQVLGSFKVGDWARIGAMSVVLKEVPANSTVVGIPGRVVRQNGEKVDTPNKEINPLLTRIAELEKKIENLQHPHG